MITALYFDAPPKVTQAVHMAFAFLGGLDLDNPQPTPRGEVRFAVKAPCPITNAYVLAIADTLALHFGVVAVQAQNVDDPSQVALAVSRTADAIAVKFGSDTPSESAQDFDPTFTTPDDLLYGLLHWSFEGNNLANMETVR